MNAKRTAALPLTCWVAVIFLAAAGSSRPLAAQPAPGSLEELSFENPVLDVPPIPTSSQTLSRQRADQLQAVRDRLAADGVSMVVHMERRCDRPLMIELSGLPWYSGRGNSIRAVRPNRSRTRALAEDFVSRHHDLLGVPLSELRWSPTGSTFAGRYLHDGTRTFRVGTVVFDFVPHGVAVEGARLVFRINNGNLVQIAMESICSSDKVPSPAAARLNEAEAEAVLADYLGGFEPGAERRDFELAVLPARPAQARARRVYRGVAGEGLSYRLAWTFVIARNPGIGEWRAGVDAVSGELLFLRDLKHQGAVRGGVRLPSGQMRTMAFPFVDYRQNPLGFTNGKGVYPQTPGARSRLQGRFVKVVDDCGAIGADQAGGSIDFGTGLPMDPEAPCTVDGTGGAGNTVAARTSYFYGDKIKRAFRTRLPQNAWARQSVQIRTNVRFADTGNGTADFRCNGFWLNDQVFMGTIDSRCEVGFGEVESVVYHELGHGLDDHDGIPLTSIAPELMASTSAEATADILAFLETKQSCIGAGARRTCGRAMEYQCVPEAGCDGAREVDYTRHDSGLPSTRATVNVTRCQGHCRSTLMTEAVWDLVTRELPQRGLSDAEAWDEATRLFYESRPSATAAYNDGPGDGGLGTGTLYFVLRAADDCDGNLLNGTPHGQAIFDALDPHDIAVGSRTDARNRDNDCGPVDPPDQTPPLVRITSPATGAVLTGPTTVTVSATDASGIDRVELQLDGQMVQIDRAHPYEFALNPSTLGNGTNHFLVAHAYDASPNRNRGTSPRVDFRVEIDPRPALELQGGRFQLRVDWKNQHNGGETGFGTPKPFDDSQQTGFFWFFDANNVELIVKVLDGRPLNGHFWVFFGSLSDVEFSLEVLDTQTGAKRIYHNPPWNVCGNADTRAFRDNSPAGTTVVEIGGSSGAITATSSQTTPGTCQPGANTLCLQDGRIKIEVDWKNQHNGGQTGVGTAVPDAGNQKTGFFWFFNQNNLELAVKVLDGRPLNGKFWVFFGTLTDVEFDLKVTDTVTGKMKTYHNPPGNICGNADTSAF